MLHVISRRRQKPTNRSHHRIDLAGRSHSNKLKGKSILKEQRSITTYTARPAKASSISNQNPFFPLPYIRKSKTVSSGEQNVMRLHTSAMSIRSHPPITVSFNTKTQGQTEYQNPYLPTPSPTSLDLAEFPTARLRRLQKIQDAATPFPSRSALPPRPPVPIPHPLFLQNRNHSNFLDSR